MSCNNCAHQATKTLTTVGVPASQVQATWAMVHQYLPRCQRCGRFLSPRNPVCTNEACKLMGEQQGAPRPWPPAGVAFTTDASKVGEAVTDAEALKRVKVAPSPPDEPEPEPKEEDPLELVTGPTRAAALEIDDANPNEGDYVITDDDNLGEGGPKTKFRHNVAAIRLLKQLEEEGRPATPEEQAILAKYTGWGGLPQLFKWDRDWQKETDELKALLTDEEWASARASTPNAHYTSPEVINAMWNGLQRLGVDGGRILEPAAGVGHFFGLSPDEITRHSTRVAVELDDISARITARLYPNATVHGCGFEEAPLPDEFFDVAISNVPFGDYGVHDPDFPKGKQFLTGSIHNYFFAKALDKVKPGGVVAFVTSRYTMDSKDPRVREYLASQADLLGAVRLPNTAFKQMAGTEVTTDVIFLRKRAEGDSPGDTDWVQAEQVDLEGGRDYDYYGRPIEHRVNQYYLDHPGMMLGKMEASGTMYRGGQAQLVPHEGQDLKVALSEAMTRLPKDAVRRKRERCRHCGSFLTKAGQCNNPKCPGKRAFMTTVDTTLKDGAFTVQEGKVYRKTGAILEEVEAEGEDQERIAGMVAVREAAQEVLRMNLEGDDEELDAARARLNKVYDDFVAQYGPLTDRANQRLFLDDPEAPVLLALERYDPETGTAEKADLFSRRTIKRNLRPETADTAKDALFISLNETGGVDIERMQELTGLTETQLQEELAGQIFRNPNGEGWETADAYLSGDVKSKLAAAAAAARINPAYQVNVDALREVQPEDLLPSDIHAGLGSGWIPEDTMTDFTHHLFGQDMSASYSPVLAEWTLKRGRYYFNKYDPRITSTWGTSRKDGIELLTDTMNGKIVTVYDYETLPDGKKRRYVNQAETMAAREMQDKIKAEFQSWIWQDPDRAERLAGIYNDRFNRTVPRKYDGSHLTLPGSAADIELRSHQKDAIHRVVQSRGTAGLFHVVGAGKTFSMIGAGMELRRLGLRNKVMHVIPNHMLEQYGNDVTKLYPNANVLLINAKDLGNARKRQETMSRIATGDWDAVVVTHNAFGKLPVSKQTQSSFIQQEIAQIDAELEAMQQAARDSRRGGSKAHKRTVKQLEKKKKRLKTKLQKLASGKRDEAVTFEQLGVDQVFVDEAHAFKNLATYSRKDRVSGIPSGSGSKRAFDMYMKTQYLQRRCARCGRFVPQSGVCLNCGGKTEIAEGGVTFATGTPIANSVAEMFTMMRYLQRDRLQELGLEHFDAWAAQFGDIVTSLEMKPSGDGYREKARFAQFNNVPELLRMWGEVADVLPDPEALSLPIPKVEGGEPVRVSAPPSDWLKEFVKECSDRAERLPNVDPRDDNMLKIIGDANKAALDRRLIDPSLSDDPNSKVNLAVDNVEQIYRDTTGVEVEGMEGPQNMAQVVFLDTSTPKPGQFNVYDDIKDKLVARGVPEDEIAFIHDAKNDTEKQVLFDKVNAGEVRVIIGSTEKMGSGTNIQQRLAALHHLDAPWRPADIEQREGRIIRPGNMNDEVGIYRYATEESFDVYRWQTLETKARFIAQVMTGDMKGRSMEDIDEVTMGYAQMKALATGNPVFIEKAQVESDLIRLAGLQRSHRDKNFQMRRNVTRSQAVIEGSEQAIRDMLEAETKVAAAPKDFQAAFGGNSRFEKRAEAGEAFMKELRRVGTTLMKNKTTREEMVGRVRGFPVIVKGRGDQRPKVVVRLSKNVEVEVAPSKSPTGNMTKLMNAVDSLPAHIEEARADITEHQQRIVGLNAELAKPFEHQAELDRLQQRLNELDAEINGLEKEGREKVANSVED